MATTVRKNDITFTITTPEDVQQDRKRHKTEPIPGTLTAVPRYPDPLKIYKLDASPYWWVRYYHKGKIHRKSTKTTSKAEALGIAKDFYTSIITGQHGKVQEEGVVTFAMVAEAMLKSKEAQMARKALTKITYSNTDYRLKKFILPHLGHRDIRSISYDDLEDLLSLLSHQGIKGSTIASYMKIARSVFVYASKSKDKIITSIPQFPTIRSEHDARGYFTKEEYHTLLVRARELIGKRFEYRKLKDANGKELPGQYFAEGTCADGRFINKTAITQELVDLIQFMTNSYVRPTDIKNLQHKHVTIVRKEHTYLRLNPPPTKGHKDPFVTMEKAVEVWDSLKEEGSAKHITLPDGTRYQFLRIEGRFVHPFNFKHYTFDRQTLRILTEDEEHSTEELVYSIDQKNSRVEKIFRLRAGTSSVLRLKSRNGTMTQTSA